MMLVSTVPAPREIRTNSYADADHAVWAPIGGVHAEKLIWNIDGILNLR